MTFVRLTDFATGRPLFVAVEHICMVYFDTDNENTCVMTTSGCAAWVQESVEDVLEEIAEDEY